MFPVLLLITLTSGFAAADTLPKELDLRKVPNVVSEVEDQGDCDSSYAFATAGLLEGQQVKSNQTIKKLIPLSAQNIIDCSSHNRGCQGGAPATAIDDLSDLGGIESAELYPQTVSPGECKFNPANRIMRPLNYLELPSGHEEIIKQEVANYGPIAVRIQATEGLIYNYTSGVFSDAKCTGTRINHSALIVGYGEDPLGGNFWLIVSTTDHCASTMSHKGEP